MRCQLCGYPAGHCAAEYGKTQSNAEVLALHAQYFQAAHRAAVARQCAQCLSTPTQYMLGPSGALLQLPGPLVPREVVDAVCSRGRDLAQLHSTMREIASTAADEERT